MDKEIDFKRVESISDFLDIWLKSSLLTGNGRNVFEKYYSSYIKRFGSYIKFNYASQVKEIMDMISKNRRLKVLEIGSGCGTEALWFALKGASVVGIDIHKQRLNVARSRKKIIERYTKESLDAVFINKSLFDLCPDEKFDIIWMEQAFHHIEPRRDVYKAIKNLLKKNGHIFISESNGYNPILQFRLFIKRGSKTLKKYYINGKEILYGIERITTPDRLAKDFEYLGVKTKLIRYFRIFPNINGDRLLSIEQSIPQWAKTLFTHYNYVGTRED